MTGRILTLNAGSSSIKFSLFEAGDRGSDREDDLLDTFCQRHHSGSRE
jgi:acetate kinase